jgi:N-acetyl-gamma-glutamyl-phosphate reductase
MTKTVFIDGGAGTTGLEIADRLSGRSDLSLLILPDSRRKDAEARREAINDADFIILCLPDDAAREAVALIANDRTRVVDASTAHRTADGWTYGFAELDPEQQDRIAAARFVSNPGCYPTGFLALVRPLVRAGIVPADFPLTVNAASGYSGGGKALIAEYETATERAFRPYGLGIAHKHGPEMQRHSGLGHAPIFAPSVVDTYRGMVVEVPLPLYALPGAPSLGSIANTLAEAYADSRIVHFSPDAVAAVSIEENAGTDRMILRVCGNAATGQARLIATLDNLGKGAGGAAVQNLNIMAGLDPTAGLVL